MELKRKTALKNQAAELETQNQQTLAKLQAELEPLRNQIQLAYSERKDAVLHRDAVLLEVEEAKRLLAETQEAVSAENRTLEAVRAEVKRQGTRVDELTESEAELIQKTTQATDKLNSISGQITVKSGELRELNTLTDKVRGDLADLQLDYETRKDAADDELRGILIKTNDAVVRLREMTEREEEERQALATERQVIQKEREALDRRQAKINTAEGKVAKYRQFMKL